MTTAGPRAPFPRGRRLRWACGVTTVPGRRADVLPRTVRSLAAAGFDRPWLFVDGCDDLQGWRREYGLDADRECEPAHGVRAAGVTCRYPRVRAYASWVLALAELYYRDPLAERFALFQDDVVCVGGLRAYLEAASAAAWPGSGAPGAVGKGYWNLWLNPRSEDPRVYQGGRYRDRFGADRPPFLADRSWVGFCPGDQTGQGALGLVFDRPTVRAVLSSWYVVERPTNFAAGRGAPPKGSPDERVELSPRGYKLVDGGLVDALKPLGYTEYVHHPSLVRHTGVRSTIDKRPNVTADDPNHPVKVWRESEAGRTFPGEDFDAESAWVR